MPADMTRAAARRTQLVADMLLHAFSNALTCTLLGYALGAS